MPQQRAIGWLDERPVDQPLILVALDTIANCIIVWHRLERFGNGELSPGALLSVTAQVEVEEQRTVEILAGGLVMQLKFAGLDAKRSVPWVNAPFGQCQRHHRCYALVTFQAAVTGLLGGFKGDPIGERQPAGKLRLATGNVKQAFGKVKESVIAGQQQLPLESDVAVQRQLKLEVVDILVRDPTDFLPLVRGRNAPAIDRQIEFPGTGEQHFPSGV